jgi:hypothetical protein
LHSEETVRRWPKRYLAEGVEGLRDIPRLGAPPKADTHLRSGRSRPSDPPPQLGAVVLAVDVAAVGLLLHGGTNRDSSGRRDRPAPPERTRG